MAKKPTRLLGSINNRPSFASRCKDNFDGVIRSRGLDYFRSGHLTKYQEKPSGADGVVVGSISYQVNLRWSVEPEPRALGVCTCPYYEGGDLCKHLWTLILKIDADGFGEKVPGATPITIDHALRTAQDDEDWDDSTDYDDFDEDNRLHSFRAPPENAWLAKIGQLQEQVKRHTASLGKTVRDGRRKRLAFYVFDETATGPTNGISILFFHREFLQNGSLSQLKRDRVSKEDLPCYEDLLDRELMPRLLLLGTAPQIQHIYNSTQFQREETKFSGAKLSASEHLDLLGKMATTGRLVRLPGGKREPVPLAFDDGLPWSFELEITSHHQHYHFSGNLVRNSDQKVERISLTSLQGIHSAGIAVLADRLVKLDAGNHFPWIEALWSDFLSPVPHSDVDKLLEVLCTSEESPPVKWPEDLDCPVVKTAPVAVLVIAPAGELSSPLTLSVDLRFAYDGSEVSSLKRSQVIFDQLNRRLLRRDATFENACISKLQTMNGVTLHDREFTIAKTQLANIASEALSWGWQVKAFGKKLRAGVSFDIKIVSGIDWFELTSEVHFSESVRRSLPDLLVALSNRDPLIELGDGTTGVLPQKWLDKFSSLSTFGKTTRKGMHFSRSQGTLLATWLNDEKVSADSEFSKLRETLASVTKLKPRKPHKAFKGELRAYQKEGLAWLNFLSEIQVGGILADDMGLGKTVQVLAHLQAQYAALPVKNHLPSLVIVPKSLLFNWQEEAARFVPNLKTITYAGSSRHRLQREFSSSDIIVMTYSTLRLDIEELCRHEFHYVIADEAQAIKNGDSQISKACRAIRARHRLAMTGTPVENSVLDLFALLDFVSPGLLGTGIRARLTRASMNDQLDEQTLKQLSQALKPFILRRTKSQVLSELPDKIEKVLHCELSPVELRRYHELRDHYRASLKNELQSNATLGRAKIAVLEALLRLRQAACHPGLIDKKQLNAPSTKVETLLEHLQEVVTEGHKALVFSQFTSFLDIVEEALARENITAVRLDGSSTDSERRETISRFQNDPSIKAFLISLKAGGVGLNLTAADYVFILDPWWNPAAESQAIDRAHRIGQKNKVIAYRLIAKSTVEEKLVELQKQKREIADALISENASLLKKLTAADLELLLS